MCDPPLALVLQGAKETTPTSTMIRNKDLSVNISQFYYTKFIYTDDLSHQTLGLIEQVSFMAVFHERYHYDLNKWY